jgi:hypothetical protein
MSAMRRAAIHKLASTAYAMDLDTLTGVIERDENGRWRIGANELDAWLMKHSGEEIVLVLGSLADDRAVEMRTCRTCGRDYMDMECPYCRANRIRLRGHA